MIDEDIGCLDDVFEEECADAERNFAIGGRCETVDCRGLNVPTVTSWGLIVLALLFMIGGKIRALVPFPERLSCFLPPLPRGDRGRFFGW